MSSVGVDVVRDSWDAAVEADVFGPGVCGE